MVPGADTAAEEALRRLTALAMRLATEDPDERALAAGFTVVLPFTAVLRKGLRAGALAAGRAGAVGGLAGRWPCRARSHFGSTLCYPMCVSEPRP